MYFAILDAARDYMRVGMARTVSPEFDCLFTGEKGARLDHVAPHLFACDKLGVIAHAALSGIEPGDVGVLLESDVDFAALRKHLRRFLIVVRERDRRRIYFRYYDPRVLKAFLPACTPDELKRFFGPITVIHCEAESPGEVISFRLRDGALSVSRRAMDELLRPPTVASVGH